MNRRFLLLLFIFGLIVGLFFPHKAIGTTKIMTESDRSTLIVSKTIASETDLENYEKQGRDKYNSRDWQGAIEFWQNLPTLYRQQGNFIAAARVSSNLALAYRQLGDWKQAETNISQSLLILDELKKTDYNPVEFDRTLAQILNTKAIVELAKGNSQTAWETWQEAEAAYDRSGDRQGALKAKINQSSALQALGFSRRSLKLLEEVKAELERDLATNIELKLITNRSLTNNLRLLGEFDRAEALGEENLKIATEIGNFDEKIGFILSLAQIAEAKNDDDRAWQRYRDAGSICNGINSCLQSDRALKIKLAQFNLLVKMGSWKAVDRNWRSLFAELDRLPIDRGNIYDRLNFAYSLLTFKKKTDSNSFQNINKIEWKEIADIIAVCARQAESIGDVSARSYALGNLGEIYELTQQWEEAKELTSQALTLARSIRATEIVYLWQWQLGRIERAENYREQAIVAYTEAVNSLKLLSKDLAAIDRQVRFSFRESVEPVYRELVSLLLVEDGNGNVSTANLERARETIEALQIAELDNFFKESCLQDKPVAIDKLDRNTAVIYPIILKDRLEVIVSIGDRPLERYTTEIAADELERVVTRLSKGLVIRSKREYYEPSQKLYQWLVAPIVSALEQNKITNLVFVPDGVLRNIPMAALYDGKQFLIEKYSVAIAPSLKLVAPRSLQEIDLKTIAVGLTEEREGFPALDYVQPEIEQIRSEMSATVLLDRDFTTKALQKEVEFSDSPIVHIATHGQFSSTLNDTFLLAWDRKIGASQIDSILQSRDANITQAIELLVLSACETATGDKRAALGMAGMAVRAGAKSTLATFWSVNDRATADFMGYFYSRLRQQNVGKAEAVREAQLYLLQNPWYKHPFYWAPYVLVGNWL
jgi:CHAT domain-containing protein/Flp pilus assembly protein TadD